MAAAAGASLMGMSNPDTVFSIISIAPPCSVATTASPAAIADNAAFDLLTADHNKYLGFVDLPTPQDFGSSIYTQTDYPGRLVKLAASSTSLFIEIETKGAFTPVSAVTFDLAILTLVRAR